MLVIQLRVIWIKSINGEWLPFNNVDLSNVNDFGVYIIWHGGREGRVVRIGQGDVANRLQSHQADKEILANQIYGPLYVTWASIPLHQRGGVERYLAETYKPRVGVRFPEELPIVVNSPWE